MNFILFHKNRISGSRNISFRKFHIFHTKALSSINENSWKFTSVASEFFWTQVPKRPNDVVTDNEDFHL